MRVELVGQQTNPSRKMRNVFKLKIFKGALIVTHADGEEEVIDLDLNDDSAPLIVQIVDNNSREDDLG